MSEFTPSGVITVTTDTGNQGPFVATMKGMMLIRCPDAKIIDLTHDAVVQWPVEAGFWLAKSFQYFPKGTVHLAAVDPGAQLEPQVLVAVHDGCVFLAPNNGVLAPLLNEYGITDVYQVDLHTLDKFDIGFTGGIFHGRDLLAPLAAEIAVGRCSPDSLGPLAEEITPSWVEEPVVSAGLIHGTIITVDSFGNLISNIGGPLLQSMRSPVIHAGSHTMRLHSTYSNVTPGDYLAQVNSFGVLELACSEQSAADGLGLGRGAPVSVADGTRRA
jgi:S-adenosylmethionine hydrolase